MKTVLKVLGCLVLLVVLVAAGGVAYLKFALPKVAPATDIKVQSSPEIIARGEYLANAVSGCMDCHSTRDWKYFSGPIVEGTLGKGGETFDHSMGFPGKLVARNITPATLGSWTDGEILRAFTVGVNKDGKALFPLMPYPAYANMSKEDTHAIIAYLRQLPPIENQVPEGELDFPLNLIVNTMPAEADPKPIPDKADTVAYGRYLVSIAGCADCHTPSEQGAPVEGKELAGGSEFGFPNGSVVRSSNISPDTETGIGGWDRAFFIQRFKLNATPEAKTRPVAAGEFNTIMPWTVYAGMTEEDLGAIYDYLRTFKPVSNKVERFSAKRVDS